MMDWGKLLDQLQGPTKVKLQALDNLQEHVQSTSLARDHISSLLDYTPQLLSDNNFKVALKVLKCWQGVVLNSQDLVKPYVHGLLPPVVERLGDNKQDVRQAACDLLLDLLQVLRPEVMMDKLSRFWGHKNWKVRHGLLQFVAEAICSTGDAVLAIPRDDSNWVLHKVIQLVGDPESAVRDAAIESLEEVYRVYGEQLLDVLSSHQLRPAHLNLIYNRLAQLGASVEPTPVQSCEASSAHDEADTASSAGAGATSRHRPSAQQDDADDASSMPAPPARAARQLSSAAPGQLRQQVSDLRPEESVTSKGIGAGAAADSGPKIKRGGYGDGGGMSKDGGLPPAPTLTVSGERELTQELERIIDTLNKGAAVDWERRVNAMVRLEGLVKGGAAGKYEVCFMEHLRMLKDPLLDQMADRRSAVARQAAHLFAVLAAALGVKFDAYVVTFMAALFKGLVITVQVVSEASDTAAKNILHHCHAPRLVPQVCDILTGDKSAKLRKHCSAFLLQMLEGWEPQEYANYLDQVEAALTAAVQDALGDTRTNGRTAFAAYAAALPDRASALLRRFDGGLQQKLHEAVVAYGKGQTAACLGVPTKQRTRQPPPSKPWKSGGSNGSGSADPEIVIVAGPPPSGSQRVSRPPAMSRGGSSNGAQRSTTMPPPPAAEHSAPAGLALSASAAMAAPAPPRAGRKSVAGVPMRVPGGPLLGPDSSSSDLGGAAVAAAAAGGRRRTSMMPQRVPYTVPEAPARTPAAAATAAYGRAAVGGAVHAGHDTLSHQTMPDSPESYAQSDTSGMGDSGAVAGLDHKGAPARLYQPHPKQLASRQAMMSTQLSAGGDDLQLQQLLRDQLQLMPQQQQQLHVHHVAAHSSQQQHLEQHQAQHMQGERSTSSLSAGLSAPNVAFHMQGLMGQAQQRPATLSKAIAGMLSNPKGWQERVEKMTALADALNRQLDVDSRPEAFIEVEKVMPKMMAAIDDAHFKVSCAALALLLVCINVCPSALEGSMEKLMPLLFLKLAGGKQSVRSAAEAALQACAMEIDADVLMPALVRSLDAMKQPAARVSVMEFVVLFMGAGGLTGMPSNTTHLRQWVSKNIPLLLDKNPNVRQMAGRALATISRMDPHTVLACLQHATPQEVAVVQRSLAEEEARAAAEEGAAAAAEEAAAVAAAAGHTWAHAANGQAFSVSSSADMSQAGSSAEQHHYGAYSDNHNMGYMQQQGHTEAPSYAAQQVHSLTGAVAGLSLTGGAASQPQQQQQHMLQQADQHQQYHYQQQPQQLAPLQHQQQYRPDSSCSGGHTSAAYNVQVTGQQQGMPAAHGYAHQSTMLAPQQQLHQQVYQQLQQQEPAMQQQAQPQPANGLAAAESARDVLGRPVQPATQAAGTPAAPAAAGQLSSTSGLQPSLPSAQQQQGPQLSSPQAASACAGAAAQAAAAAAAAGDASSQARHLTVLVHRLQSRPAEDVLGELAACAGVLCSQAWEDNFQKVLLAGLSATQNGSEAIRELAFLLVLALVQNHSRLFEPVLDVVLQPLLQGCGDDSREVLIAAQQALDVLMQEMPPLRCADTLAHKLPSEAAISSGTAVDGEVLCSTIRCLQLVCRRMSPAELLSVGPSQLLPGLFAAFHHPRPDVRKAVVFCLVDMWHAAGEGLTPHLASLSTSQLKLLTIYYNRAQGKQQSVH